MSTRDVLNHHLEAFGAGDVDGIVSDYTEDSVILTPDGPVRGLSAIRGMFENFTGKLLPPGSDFEMLQMDVEGEHAFILWNAESDAATFAPGTDTFHVVNDKIAFQTFAGNVTEKG